MPEKYIKTQRFKRNIKETVDLGRSIGLAEDNKKVSVGLARLTPQPLLLNFHRISF